MCACGYQNECVCVCVCVCVYVCTSVCIYVVLCRHLTNMCVAGPTKFTWTNFYVRRDEICIFKFACKRKYCKVFDSRFLL